MSKIKIKKLSTLDIVYISMFTAIMTICSWISIPTSIPFTLQTFGVFLSVVVLGGKRGTFAVLIYILLGMIGIPVFAGFTGGIGVLFGSTGGYIIGFLFSAIAMWFIEFLLGKKKWTLLLSMSIGLLVCYIFGTIWFVIVYAHNSESIGVLTVLMWCVIPYIIPDIIKIALALSLSKRLGSVCRFEEK